MLRPHPPPSFPGFPQYGVVDGATIDLEGKNLRAAGAARFFARPEVAGAVKTIYIRCVRVVAEGCVRVLVCGGPSGHGTLCAGSDVDASTGIAQFLGKRRSATVGLGSACSHPLPPRLYLFFSPPSRRKPLNGPQQQRPGPRGCRGAAAWLAGATPSREAVSQVSIQQRLTSIMSFENQMVQEFIVRRGGRGFFGLAVRGCLLEKICLSFSASFIFRHFRTFRLIPTGYHKIQPFNRGIGTTSVLSSCVKAFVDIFISLKLFL